MFIRGCLIGVFDLLNVRDIDLIDQAASECDHLQLLLLDDDDAWQITQRRPVVALEERARLVSHVRGVDQVSTFRPELGEAIEADRIWVSDDSRDVAVRSSRLLHPRRRTVSTILRRALFGEHHTTADEVEHLLHKPQSNAVGEATGGLTGYVPGAWDMFHVGHLNILERARSGCDRLVVGVVTDQVLFDAKAKWPIVPLEERMELVSRLDLVDEVVPDLSSDKLVAWEALHFDILFKGDDWRGTPKGERLERDLGAKGVTVQYFPYTQSTSSTALRTLITQAS